MTSRLITLWDSPETGPISASGLQVIDDHLPLGSILAVGPDQPEDLAPHQAISLSNFPARDMRHPGRRGQYYMGRHLARRALKALDLPSDGLTSNADGSCQWPPATVGSISHTRGLAAAWVAPNDAYPGLGIDVERQRDLSAAAQRYVLTPQEAESQDISAVMRCSAKEAIYKCLAPRDVAPLRFHDVSIFADGCRLRFEPSTQCSWGRHLNDLQGFYYWTENHVLTMVWSHH